ncbi:polysaccharide deacetylase family protein [Thalassospira sp. CH_XMU1448-2]|uniref:polysaccharide deacetylase family protein n=1 Tax=Thalassospira sp. CH_XMU1448-2 TaxID=3107773 RepID=UPI00300B83C6
MNFKAKGQRSLSAAGLIQSGTMLRSAVFGMSFAVGLTFGIEPGNAQSVETGTGTSSDVQTEAPVASSAATPAGDEGNVAAPDAPVAEAEPEAEPATEPQMATAQQDASEPAVAAPGGDASSAVVFMYHRFGEGEYPSTNIRPEQFKEHVAELTNGNYTVMGLPQIVEALENGKGLPDRTVGITVDDAYRSVYETAWPIFRANNMPFTVFVSTEQLDDGFANYMTWDMVREMVKAGVTIGGHSQHHSHLPDLDIEAVKAELAHAAERFKAELGFVPDIFAYPYGEADADVINAVKEAGYKAAFGQQSGAMSTESDFMYLPRFALNEHYGAMDRFKLAANSLPLRVSDITPGDYTLTRNPPAFGFTLTDPTPDIACYPSDGQATMTRLGDERVEIRLDGPVASGRWRINCTAMGPESRWRWFGMLYTVP